MDYTSGITMGSIIFSLLIFYHVLQPIYIPIIPDPEDNKNTTFYNCGTNDDPLVIYNATFDLKPEKEKNFSIITVKANYLYLASFQINFFPFFINFFPFFYLYIHFLAIFIYIWRRKKNIFEKKSTKILRIINFIFKIIALVKNLLISLE